MVFDEDDAEGLDEDVQDTVHQRDVEVPEDDDGLDEAKDERTNHRQVDHIGSSEILSLDLAFRLERWVIEDTAEAEGTAIENAESVTIVKIITRTSEEEYLRRGRRLWKEEDQEGERETAEPEEYPNSPSPALALNCEPTD